jgi:all-trans-retinol dehydrogenase (NAD+)
MKSIAGEIALVTGGASGIGRLLAFGLAEAGARVVAWDIDEAALGRLEAEAARRELDIVGMACDVSKREDVYAKAKEVLKRFGSLGILVNNAGIVSGKTLLETPDERIEKSRAINALASFWTVKAFLPAMLERRAGRIVTISSAAGIVGVTGLADYSASKFAAFGFNESLRMELRKLGSPVRTLIVCPFFVDTGLFAGVKTKVPLLLPILKQDYVAKRILGAIRKGKKRLVLPFFVYSVWLLRLFPVGFMDAMADFFGISASMDHFTGRSGGPAAGGRVDGK